MAYTKAVELGSPTLRASTTRHPPETRTPHASWRVSASCFPKAWAGFGNFPHPRGQSLASKCLWKFHPTTEFRSEPGFGNAWQQLPQCCNLGCMNRHCKLDKHAVLHRSRMASVSPAGIWLPGPPKVPKIMAQHLKIQSTDRQYRVHYFGPCGGPGTYPPAASVLARRSNLRFQEHTLAAQLPTY